MYAVGKKYAKVKGTIDDYLDESIEVELIYYHYNNLGSTRVMTNQAGEKVFDQDYLPFGGDLPKPGQLEVQNGTDESYKYTGQKQVASIGLYYYKARYYDPAVGRFTRQDSYRGELANPQTQHLYVYTLNNPLKYTDPTGNKAWYVHGTFADQSAFKEGFINAMNEKFNEDNSTRFGWTGGNTDKVRQQAAERLAKNISAYHDKHSDEPIYLIGHSHGGNVAIEAANRLDSEDIQVNNLVTIATPVREYKVEGDNVKFHNQIYNKYDMTQVSGGDLVPGVNLLNAAQLVSDIHGEVGPAGRKFKGANNIQYSEFKPDILGGTHGLMHNKKKAYQEWMPLLQTSNNPYVYGDAKLAPVTGTAKVTEDKEVEAKVSVKF